MNEEVLLRTDSGLRALTPEPFLTEDALQALLASSPEVIAGSSATTATAGRLILVRREQVVPSGTGGARFSADYLFLTLDGVPVIVEVKRASDTRIRREVVGQMLDYAANAVRYWPIAMLRAAAEATATANR